MERREAGLEPGARKEDESLLVTGLLLGRGYYFRAVVYGVVGEPNGRLCEIQNLDGKSVTGQMAKFVASPQGPHFTAVEIGMRTVAYLGTQIAPATPSPLSEQGIQGLIGHIGATFRQIMEEFEAGKEPRELCATYRSSLNAMKDWLEVQLQPAAMRVLPDLTQEQVDEAMAAPADAEKTDEDVVISKEAVELASAVIDDPPPLPADAQPAE